MASAIWSAPPAEILDYPAAAFLRFQLNHGLPPADRTADLAHRRRRLHRPRRARLIRPLGLPCPRWRRRRPDRADRRAGRRRRYAGRARRLRSGGHRDPRRRGARALGGAGRAGARAARRLPLQPQRSLCFISTRRSCPAAGRRGRAGTSSPARISPSDASVTYWMNRASATSDAAGRVRHAQPPRRRPESACSASRPRSPDLRHGRAESSEVRFGASRAREASGSAARISAQAFTRTAFSRASRSPRQLGGVRRPWRVENESGRIIVGVEPSPPAREKAA